MLTSSTACSMCRENAPPILKCFVSPAVRSSMGGSVMAGLSVGVQEAADQRAVDVIQLRRLLLAPGHDLGAARGEPAARGRAGQVRRAAGNAGQRYPGALDRGEGVHQADGVGVLRRVEHL